MTDFTIFFTLRADCVILRGQRMVALKDVLASINDRETMAGRFDTLSKIWHYSLVQSALKVKNCEICNFRGFDCI